MFSSKSQLQKRTPENGTDRENFLSLLVDEFLHSSSYEAKCQVLANLANFAYDPINYGYIRDVGVLDIFLHVLKNEADQNLQHFAIAGVCNLCLDPENARYVVDNSGVNPVKALLKSNNTDILADTITTLLFPYIAMSNKNYQKICKIHTTTFSSTAFKAGDKIRIQKTLTQKDLDAFSNLTSDHNYLHQNNGNKRPIVHGALLNGLVAGLIGTHLPGPGTVLVSQTMKFPNKCFVGEKLTISVELVDVRKILKVKFFCIVEEEKKVVFEGEAKLMLAKDC
ncbi:Armadillo repeat-containing protein 7 [Operophtera brumata]|uniref:Armadillo repeat-containing protein 7 n=1 Tax=Operophtera brumata TaxID=104452 RepID=A0A0L7LEF4_OPEBR|nr:Armadillo repeat-containing protein 7 [Operophtera brumata]